MNIFGVGGICDLILSVLYDLLGGCDRFFNKIFEVAGIHLLLMNGGRW